MPHHRLPNLITAAVVLWWLLFLTSCAIAGFMCESYTQVAVVYLAYQRPTILRKSLQSLQNTLSCQGESDTQIAVYVSIDDNARSKRVRKAAEREGVPMSCIWSHTPNNTHSPRERIAAHYHFVFSTVFDSSRRGHNFVIVLEDDLLLAPDFIPFFLSFLPIIASHGDDGGKPVCVSGWNDNGASPARCNPSGVSRTTFFPGLGWAISRGFWTSTLYSTWPRGNASIGDAVSTGWDFWLRAEFDSSGWHCITPDVTRVFHHGKQGTNVRGSSYLDQCILADSKCDQIQWKLIAEQFVSSHIDCFADIFSKATVVGGLNSAWIRDLNWDCTSNSPLFICMEGVKHFVLFYNREDYYNMIASRSEFLLWPEPRGHFDHILSLALTESRMLHLVDKRRSTRVPSSMRSHLPDFAFLSAAAQGESCTLHCESLVGSTRTKYTCTAKNLEYANDCDQLKRYFKCKKCAYETGLDLPAFVATNALVELETAGLCLITEVGLGQDGSLDCEGSHVWTKRLCACERARNDEHQQVFWSVGESIEGNSEL